MRYHKNDRIHPLLSKAAKPGQVRVDALDAGPRKAQYGAVSVREVEIDEALTEFSMGGPVKRTAWSLNPYAGCLHACTFCYVPETMHVERPNWGSYVIAKTNLPTKLRRELATKGKQTVYLSTGTDPYQSLESEHQVTRACLIELAKKDWPLEIITRSPLVLRDVDLLRRFSRVQIGLSVPTLDDQARRLLEPAAPPISARLDALRRLSGLGFRVYANYVPVYPPTNGFTLKDVAETFRDAGSSGSTRPTGLVRRASWGPCGTGFVARNGKTWPSSSGTHAAKTGCGHGCGSNSRRSGCRCGTVSSIGRSRRAPPPSTRNSKSLPAWRRRRWCRSRVPGYGCPSEART